MPRQRLSFLGKWRNPIGLIGAGIVLFNVLVAVFGKYIWTLDPDAQDSDRLQAPSWAHPMGTDELGRDELARIIHGAPVSLQVGFIAVGIALVAGDVARPGRRLLQGLGRRHPDAHRRPHVRAAGPRLRDRDRRSPRAEPAQRDDRDRDRVHPGVRSRRARVGARGDGLPVHRVDPRARRPPADA